MRGHHDATLSVGWTWDLPPAGPASPTRMTQVDGDAADPASAVAPADFETADDRALVAAFLAGHREAFDAIVRRHRRNVYQLCYRFLGNHEDASDLTQDVFIRAFKSLASFKHESALGTWLYRVGVNTCLNRLAAKTPETEPVEQLPLVDPAAGDPLGDLMRAETAARVRQAIRQLPPKQRATLILRVYHELRHDEIARVLGSSVGAAKANLFHALVSLKRLMGS